ncbi:aminodeoxychorismate/anthranilate synthase component II [Pseudidiomarina sp. 1APP75-32.1]|uniref:Aminodeoxychorismate/anthranilate synthase component II n=1 Tax=Pseudidiomarina terrestris TaxID=2820060 RepID=A0AAW7QXV2_9GAMM|nr:MULTISPECIES: aminodeoxychorismate/anthranilate synthase component II [unclassified Pseudidiomarina]MDN7125006.1 aminodeoxychorismate/anthranilate synthase component II [Pseudidiomarina sp. 1APP75-32.1]MDN7129519.1 aminodeoxychorismate/anthranilate synthase component II [Pseudidiomarina sp. 1APR75-15]
MLLMIDNYDSFTHNVVRYFRELGAEVKVVRNDAITLADIAALPVTGIVLSPGPCTPNEAGVCLQVIEQLAGKVPILGVCLGHQAIGQVFGGQVVRAAQVMHGKTSQLEHGGEGLMKALPATFRVARYHSLLLAPETIPDCLVIDAWTTGAAGEREIMALHHRQLPVWGVQYHPEAVETEYGHAVLQNFLDACASFRR